MSDPSRPSRSPERPRRALVIAHEPDGPGGQVTVRLEERGFEVDTHVVTTEYDRPDLAAPFPSTDGYDVVAIMGSVRSVTEPEVIEAWLPDELDLIRRVHRAETPLLGVCFGGQLIAEALGGSVEKAPETELGWFEIEAPDGVTNPVGAGPWMEWHHDRFDPPPGSTVLATTPRAVQLYRIDRTVGTQFHPEVDVAHITGWLTQADESYLATHGWTSDGILADMEHHEERNTAQCKRLVDWFLDEVADGAVR